jgi:hypothetical protein
VAKSRIGQKPRLNVYTMMLVIAFVALTVGSVVLLLEIRKWGEDSRPWDTGGVQVKSGFLLETPADAIRPFKA